MGNVETARPVPVSTIASTPAAPAEALVALADRVRARSHDDPAPLADPDPLRRSRSAACTTDRPCTPVTLDLWAT